MRRVIRLVNVFLVIMILIMSAIALDAYFQVQKANPLATPIGEMDSYVRLTQHEMLLRFDYVNPATDFSQCQLRFLTPSSTLTTVDLQAGKQSYYVGGGTSALSWVVLSNDTDGRIDQDDNITISSLGPLDVGLWEFSLIYMKTGKSIVDQQFIVPDIRSTPVGTFLTPVRARADTVTIGLGVFTPTTPYCYTSLVVTTPGGQTQTIPLRFSSSEYQLNDTLSVRIADVTDTGIITVQDHVDLVTSAGRLAPGIWTVSLVYNFTGGTICTQIFNVG
jgi:hypothetical protein